MKKPGATRTPPLLTRSQPGLTSNKRSHNSRAPTAPKKKLKKPIGFMDLPGELRNKIYDYYFQQEFICEFVDKEARLSQLSRATLNFSKNDGRTTTKYLSHQDRTAVTTVRFSRMLGGYNRIRGLDAKWKTSLTGLIFVSKKIHVEIIALFYSNTLFCFNAPNRVLNFLKVVAAPNLANVTKIQLHYHTYGDPQKTKDIPWKEKHLKRWDDTCRIAATRLINLEHIDILVHMKETNVCLTLSEPSLRPLFWFRRCNDPTRNPARVIEAVSVEIKTMWTRRGVFSDPRLSLASETLHDLFGAAVSRFILGQSEEDATEILKIVWNVEFVQWRHHLRFMPPGW